MLDPSPIGVEHAILLVGAATLGDIVLHAHVIPETFVAQAQAEGDAITGQEQKMWLLGRVRTGPKNLGGVGRLYQGLACTWINLRLEVCYEFL